MFARNARAGPTAFHVEARRQGCKVRRRLNRPSLLACLLAAACTTARAQRAHDASLSELQRIPLTVETAVARLRSLEGVHPMPNGWPKLTVVEDGELSFILRSATRS